MLNIGNIIQAETIKAGSGVNTISKLILHPYRSQHMISISHDGVIKVWEISTLKEVSRKQIKTPYLTSIIQYQDGFLLGAGSGKLIQLSKYFDILKQYQIHDDCLTDIIQLSDSIVTVGFDGKIVFLNKNTLEMMQEINTDTPLHKIVLFNSSLYITGTPSYKLDLKDLSLEELGNYQNFILFQNEILGCSEQNGLTRLSNNQKTFEPCEFAFSFRNTIIMFSAQSVGFVKLQEEDEINWTVHKIPHIEKNFSISACLQDNQGIILASQSSRIIRVELLVSNS